MSGYNVSAQSKTLNQHFSQQNGTSTNFFLDCKDCDLIYIQQELPFVSFVRDPLLADVHILVTDSGTGSGGRKYYLNFIGKKEFEGINNEYIVTTNQSETDDVIRKTLLQSFKIGILQYYSKTSFINRLHIIVEDNESKKAEELYIDHWNNWIISVESGGQFHKEKSQNDYTLTTGAGIRKTTEEWKGAITANYEIKRENYYDENDNLISSRQYTNEISGRFIKSLTNRWSARIYGEYSANSFLNIQHKITSSAAIEYNIFPWTESHKRTFVIRYNIGVGSYKYIAETIYDKMYETLSSESLEVHIQLIQQWGQMSLGLEGSHLFQNFSKNQLNIETDLSLRISKNISVFCNLKADMIHDQFYLPKGDVSLEDLLLKRRKLLTNYEMSGLIGFRFTFGSIYTNVVNERF